MKKIIYMLALFAALTANAAIAQNRDQVINKTYEPGIYNDQGGEYRWQIIEKRVWIPQHQTRGLFGIGVRTVPGHYEMRTTRTKVYTRNSQDGQYNDNNNQGWKKGKHPHGMPPGQRKKMDRERGNDERDNNGRDNNEGDHNEGHHNGRDHNEGHQDND